MLLMIFHTVDKKIFRHVFPYVTSVDKWPFIESFR